VSAFLLCLEGPAREVPLQRSEAGA